jgi:hypothetical protein
MNNQELQQNQDNELIRARRVRDLESPLAGVIEQDGIVLITPTGVRKRAKRIRAVKPEKKRFNFTNCLQVKDDIADVELFDEKIIACAVDNSEPPIAICVQVNNCPHSRSEYVVSLRDCFLGDVYSEDRVSPDEQLSYVNSVKQSITNPKSYASVVLTSEAEPWMIKNQSNINENGRIGVMASKFKKIKRAFIRPEVQVTAKKITSAKITDEPVTSVFERVKVKSFLLAFLGLVIVAAIPAFALSTYKTLAVQKDAFEQKGNEAAAFAFANISANDALPVSHQALANVSVKFRETARMLDDSRLLAFSAAAVAPSKYRGARALIEVGEKTSEAAKIITLGFGKIFDDPKRPLMERIIVLGAHAEAALPLLQDAENAARLVKPDQFPEEYQNAIVDLPKQIVQAQTMVRELKLISDAMTVFLGKDQLRNYLLVFQNDSELRPSGGFMGSVAEIRFLNGKIHSIYVPPGGPYDLKSQLTARVQAPLPMHLINPLWQFQDANWHADFSKTANSINWFWSKSGQPTLDGIVAVNASFMEKILSVIGPVEMPEYGKTITAENFYLETQKAVELEYDKTENAPKKFIGDMFDKILENTKNLSKEQWLMLAAISSEALDTKNIQIAMFNQDEEALIDQFGWGGSFKQTEGDFLAIVGANIAGQKTDLVVKESVLHEVTIDFDGSITNKVLLNRNHEGVKNELFYGVRNVQYVRFYLPKGSEVLDAQGFLPPPENLFKKPLPTDPKDELLESIESTQKSGPNTTVITTEGNHTVVGGWLQLDPGRSQDVMVSYRLPFNIQDILRNLNSDMPESAKSEQSRAAYLMLYTSQSGKARPLTVKFIVDSAWEAVWSKNAIHENIKKEAGKAIIELETTWDRDKTAAILFNAK